MSEIKPALTPEEWKAVEDGHKGGRYASDDFGAHGAAASLLYDQPFGFTWEDVDLLTACMEDAEGEGGSAEYVGRIESIRDRVAALLPPRQP